MAHQTRRDEEEAVMNVTCYPAPPHQADVLLEQFPDAIPVLVVLDGLARIGHGEGMLAVLREAADYQRAYPGCLIFARITVE